MEKANKLNIFNCVSLHSAERQLNVHPTQNAYIKPADPFSFIPPSTPKK